LDIIGRDETFCVHGFQVSGFRPATALTPHTLYETTPKWHGFLMIKLAAFQASGSACMKLHEFRQDLQDYQDFFGLV
jgi:hypothetical protein